MEMDSDAFFKGIAEESGKEECGNFLNPESTMRRRGDTLRKTWNGSESQQRRKYLQTCAETGPNQHPANGKGRTDGLRNKLASLGGRGSGGGSGANGKGPAKESATSRRQEFNPAKDRLGPLVPRPATRLWDVTSYCPRNGGDRVSDNPAAVVGKSWRKLDSLDRGDGAGTTNEEEIQLTMSCSCMELALEGERLCKAGDCRMGVQFFEAAVEAGTDDLKTLSAIYSQLGNAYFYLQDYGRALEYHKHDLNLARTTNDKIGEAKASGNLGNTLKVIGRFDEAIVCCLRHLEISREIEDKVGEARALYNLGNVYHAKGKHLGRHGNQDPGEFAPEVKECLEKAVHYYDENLNLVRSLSDRAAEGRACGNLGNTHYLLGNFAEAISFHEQRLSIAKEYGDKAAERRAYTNLGNAHIFLGDFELAADYYKKSLQIAKQLGDRALEAQACYSLGNTYTLMRDFETAVIYHQKHLAIAQELLDRVGEGRACWSLGNANSALGHHRLALQYATRHLNISRDIGDQTGMMTAQMNLADLKGVLGISDQSNLPGEAADKTDLTKPVDKARRFSMENMELMKLTPDKKTGKPVSGGARPKQKVQKSASVAVDMGVDSKGAQQNGSTEDFDDDGLFDLLTRFQSRRIDDQRCSLRLQEQPSPESDESKDIRLMSSPASEKLMDMVAGFQSSRMNDQRASLPTFPGLTSQAVIGQLLESSSGAGADGSGNDDNNSRKMPDDNFFEMLMRCQATRLEDQRSSLPMEMAAPTVPDEDFLSLIMRVQSSRIDEQRSNLPEDGARGGNKKGT